MSSDAKYKRVLLKFSGEALMGDAQFGISNDILSYLAEEVRELRPMDIEIGIVIGAGNIFRGVSGASAGMDRAAADNMGMLATVMNSLALKDALDQNNVPTAVLSAIPMNTVCESFSRRLSMEHFAKGNTVIFAAGTGNPYFTTDTAASLRAAEIDADIVLKSTRVEGVYSSDPEKNDEAELYTQISYKDVVEKKLGVMDLTAITLCEENKMPIRVFDGTQNTNIYNVLTGNELGTLIN